MTTNRVCSCWDLIFTPNILSQFIQSLFCLRNKIGGSKTNVKMHIFSAFFYIFFVGGGGGGVCNQIPELKLQMYKWRDTVYFLFVTKIKFLTWVCQQPLNTFFLVFQIEKWPFLNFISMKYLLFLWCELDDETFYEYPRHTCLIWILYVPSTIFLLCRDGSSLVEPVLS